MKHFYLRDTALDIEHIIFCKGLKFDSLETDLDKALNLLHEK